MTIGFSRNKHVLNIGLFSTIALFTMQAANSAPLFVIEKTLEPQRMIVVITSLQIPELINITFTCSYAIPKASILDAIVSSPQPGTALSVIVDSTTSTLSITLQAATTMTPSENARIIVLAIPASVSPLMAADFTVTKAVITDKAGTSAIISVNNNPSGTRYPPPTRSIFSRHRITGGATAYLLDGKNISSVLPRQVSRTLIIQRDDSRIISTILFR